MHNQQNYNIMTCFVAILLHLLLSMLFNYLAEMYMQFATGNTQTRRKLPKGTFLEVQHLKHL